MDWRLPDKFITENFQASCKNSACLILFISCYCYAQQPVVEFFPNYHSIGYRIVLPAGFDSDSNATIVVRYYSGHHPIDTAFTPYRLRQNTFNEFRGSLFMLQSGVTYQVVITITDSTPVLQTFVFTDSITTRSEPTLLPTTTIRYVSPTGSGNAFTLSQPGNLADLFNNNLISCGTTVMLLDGIYQVSHLTLNINTDCSPQLPVIIMAAPGAHPILDGGYYQQLNWTTHPYDSTLYSAHSYSDFTYSTLCLINGERLYPYAGINSSNTLPNLYPLEHLGYGLSGFCRNTHTIWIKTIDGKNPNHFPVVFSKHTHAIIVNGNGHQCFLYLKGITFRHYGRPYYYTNFLGNIPESTYPAVVLELRDVNHVFIDSCTFSYNNYAIKFEGACNYNTVQRCIIKDNVGLWGHEAIKESAKEYLGPLIGPNTTVGRNLENAGIYFNPGHHKRITGNVIRANYIEGMANGIITGNIHDVSEISETDIYDNRLIYCYDGIGNMSGQINLRIFNNEISHGPVGLSFISARYGPYYVFRNVIHHISDRENPSLDPFRILFSDCNGTVSNKIWGTGVKMNAGVTTPDAGALFLMHNTFHADDTLAFAMYLWKSNGQKIYSRNNSFYAKNMSTFFFDDVANNPVFSFDSEYDNYFNALSGNIAIIQPVNSQPLCYYYTMPSQLDTGLRQITLAANVRVKNGFNCYPEFRAIGSDFHLLCTSPLIDMGTLLPGINHRHYYGNKPDIGAFELEKTTDYIVTIDTIYQTDTLYHFSTTGTTTHEYIYDTIYTHVNEITHDTLWHVDCIWLPIHYEYSDSLYVSIITDTINSCDSMVFHTTYAYHHHTITNAFDSTLCDTLVSYLTVVKVNVLSVNNSAIEMISFYPNPASEMIRLKNNDMCRKHLIFIDTWGNTFSIQCQGNQIPVSMLKTGIYIMLADGKPMGKLLIMRP